VKVRARIVETLTYLAYRGMNWLCPILPTRTGRSLSEVAGRLLYRLAPKLRETVAANQGQVLGRPVDDLLVRASTRDAFALYARYWFDTFHVQTWDEERLARDFRYEGLEHMEKGLAEGRGVIFALPHIGNWDVGGRAIADRVARPVAVAEHLKPEGLFELFLAHRARLRMDIVDLDSDHVGRQLTAHLEKNRIVGLVADRDFSGRGVEVEMFGRTRRMPAGPASLSLSTGALLVCGPVYQTPDGWLNVFTPVSIEPTGDRKQDVRSLTQELATAFEVAIAAAPSDWHLFQPGWDA
jgi:lauroyl/myristoyl acyltransferase